VKRIAKIIRSNSDGTRSICVDLDNYAEIIEYISRSAAHKKRFNYITGVILEGLRMPDVYDKEDINDKCKGVTAMKLFKGGSNDRIYCREQTLEDKTFVVITSELFEKKKSQKINQKIKNTIQKVASYEYEIIK
jgi:hypothetical protein